MWINYRWKMMRRMQLIRFFLIILLFNELAYADKTTIERIRKHQEWLKQRLQQKSNNSAGEKFQKTSYELANLWRFQKSPLHNVNNEKPSLNEVYPENETIINTTTSTNITTTTTTTPPATSSTTSAPPINEVILLTTTLAAVTTEQPRSEEQSVLPTMPPMSTTTETSRSVVNVTLAPPQITTTTISATVEDSSTSGPLSGQNSTVSSVTSSPKRSRPKVRPYPRWGNWSHWSECSRSCGGGVRFQQRRCINR